MSKTDYEFYYNKAEDLKLKGLLHESIVEYDKAVKIRPQFWLAHYHKGEVLQSQKEFLKAGITFATAAVFSRGRPEPKLMAARAFYFAKFSAESMEFFSQVSLSDFDETSFSIYLDVLAASNKFEQALELINSGIQYNKNVLYLKAATKTYEGLGDFVNAKKLLDKLITLTPDKSFGYSLRSSSYLMQGHLTESIACSKEAIGKSLDHIAMKAEKGEALDDSSSSYMDNYLAEYALQGIVKVLDDANIPYCLMCGTLLGFYRDGAILPHDKDVDIGILPGTNFSKIFAAFEGNKDFLFSRDYRSEQFKRRTKRNVVVKSRLSDISADFFFLEDCGDKFKFGFHNPKIDFLWEHEKFSIVKTIFNNFEYSVPDNIPKNLSEMYGPDWKIPNAKFDSILASPNVTKESKELAIAFGYKRLESKITDGAFEKALWYVDVIKQEIDDPWLVKIELEIKRYL